MNKLPLPAFATAFRCGRHLVRLSAVLALTSGALAVGTARAQVTQRATTAVAPVAAAPVAVAPDDVEAQTEAPVVKPGEGTRNWLGAQSQKQQASRTRPTLSGPVLTRVHKQYQDSFALTREPTPFHDSRSLSGDK